MSAHTPGPWQIVNGTDVFTPLGAVNAAGVHAAHNDGWHIADCGGFYTSTDDGECQLEFREEHANARLIAAAPELLAFAVAFVDLFNGDPDSPIDQSQLEQARAAIAKATGAQP